MTHTLTAATQFRRINPHAGLMIDVDVWRDAHEYHRDQIRLHHLALHGWGIVQGLEVTIAEGTANTVRIEPGIGIDAAGNFIIVPAPHTYQFTAREPGTIYLVLQFRDVAVEPATQTPGAANGIEPTRVVEAYRIQERDRLPNEPYLELARLDFDPRRGAVRRPSTPTKPVQNELDVRSRIVVGGVAPPLTVAGPASATAASAELGELAGQLASLRHRVDLIAQRPTPERADKPEDGHARSPDSSPWATSSYRCMRWRSALTRSPLGRPTCPDVRGPLERIESISRQVDAFAQQLGELERTGSATAPQLENLGQRLQTLGSDLERVSGEVAGISAQIDATRGARATVQLRLAVAEHDAAGWDSHRQGLRHLVRELGGVANIGAEVVEPAVLGNAERLDVVFLSGQAGLSIGDREVEALTEILDRGGVVVGEGCAAGPQGEAGAREFALSFVDLATRLGRQLARVDREHPIMAAEHLFAELPPGARTTARLLEAGGMVYSDADYGCAWQGGPTERALPRGTIRDALEFGVNLALFRRAARG